MTDLHLSIEKFNPPVVVAADLTLAFKDFFQQMEEWEEKASTLIVEDESQTGLMFQAGVARKALAAIRVAVEKQRKIMKEEALRTGQAIDGVARMMRERLENLEAHLAQQENYIVNREAARIEALRIERVNKIMPYLHPENITSPYPDWGTMHEEDFAATLALAVAKENEIEQARVAKIIQEAADREELERLRKESAAKDAELAAARKAQAEAEQAAVREAAFALRQKEEKKAGIEAEKQLRERTERENEQQRLRYLQLNKEFQAAKSQSEQALQEVEQYKKQLDADVEEEAKTLLANLAPQTDRDKIRAYVAAIEAIPFPVVESEDMKIVAANLAIAIEKIKTYTQKHTA